MHTLDPTRTSAQPLCATERTLTKPEGMVGNRRHEPPREGEEQDEMGQLIKAGLPGHGGRDR